MTYLNVLFPLNIVLLETGKKLKSLKIFLIGTAAMKNGSFGLLLLLLLKNQPKS